MSAAKKRRPYVGYKRDRSREVFLSAETPTEETHGGEYFATVGPFRTRRGAEYMRDHGASNPHVVTVAQAEQLAKESK